MTQINAQATHSSVGPPFLTIGIYTAYVMRLDIVPRCRRFWRPMRSIRKIPNTGPIQKQSDVMPPSSREVAAGIPLVMKMKLA